MTGRRPISRAEWLAALAVAVAATIITIAIRLLPAAIATLTGAGP